MYGACEPLFSITLNSKLLKVQPTLYSTDILQMLSSSNVNVLLVSFFNCIFALVFLGFVFPATNASEPSVQLPFTLWILKVYVPAFNFIYSILVSYAE